MGEWREVSLYDVAEYINGRPTKPSEATQRGVPVIKIAELNRGITDNTNRVAAQLVEDKHWVSPGDLLFAWSGSVGVYKYSGPRAALNQHIFRVVARPEVDQVFLRYLLLFYLPTFLSYVENKKTTMGHVTIKDIQRTVVFLPPLSEQRAIAEVLGALDDKIEGNRKTATFIEELLAMEFALAQFDSIHNNPVALKDIIKVNPPRPRPNGKLAPYIDMNALPINSALVNEYAVRESKSGSRFQNGDTLFARITPCLENGKAAFIDCLEGSSIGIGSTEFIVMRPKPSVPAQFAYFLARSERFREYAIKHMSGSSGRQRCPADSIGLYPLQQPDYNNLNAFGKKCDEGFSLMRSLLNESYLLALLRDTLLPKLLSGELRIKDTKQLLELTV